MEASKDFEELFELLNRNKVEYLLLVVTHTQFMQSRASRKT